MLGSAGMFTGFRAPADKNWNYPKQSHTHALYNQGWGREPSNDEFQEAWGGSPSYRDGLREDLYSQHRRDGDMVQAAPAVYHPFGDHHAPVMDSWTIPGPSTHHDNDAPVGGWWSDGSIPMPAHPGHGESRVGSRVEAWPVSQDCRNHESFPGSHQHHMRRSDVSGDIWETHRGNSHHSGRSGSNANYDGGYPGSSYSDHVDASYEAMHPGFHHGSLPAGSHDDVVPSHTYNQVGRNPKARVGSSNDEAGFFKAAVNAGTHHDSDTCYDDTAPSYTYSEAGGNHKAGMGGSNDEAGFFNEGVNAGTWYDSGFSHEIGERDGEVNLPPRIASVENLPPRVASVEHHDASSASSYEPPQLLQSGSDSIPHKPMTNTGLNLNREITRWPTDLTHPPGAHHARKNSAEPGLTCPPDQMGQLGQTNQTGQTGLTIPMRSDEPEVPERLIQLMQKAFSRRIRPPAVKVTRQQSVFTKLLKGFSTACGFDHTPSPEELEHQGITSEIRGLQLRRAAASELLDEVEAEIEKINRIMEDKSKRRMRLLQILQGSAAKNQWLSCGVDAIEVTINETLEQRVHEGIVDLRPALRARLEEIELSLSEKENDLRKARQELAILRAEREDQIKQMKDELIQTKADARKRHVQKFASLFDHRSDASVQVAFLAWRQMIQQRAVAESLMKKSAAAHLIRVQEGVINLCFAQWKGLSTEKHLRTKKHQEIMLQRYACQFLTNIDNGLLHGCIFEWLSVVVRRRTEMRMAAREQELDELYAGWASRTATDHKLEMCLKVAIQDARGLRCPDGVSELAAHCLCQIPGKPCSQFQTRTAIKALNPSWNEEGLIPGFALGDSLAIRVINRSNLPGLGGLLGKVTLDSRQFYPRTYDGEVHLSEEDATLSTSLVMLEQDSAKTCSPVTSSAHNSGATLRVRIDVLLMRGADSVEPMVSPVTTPLGELNSWGVAEHAAVAARKASEAAEAARDAALAIRERIDADADGKDSQLVPPKGGQQCCAVL